MSGREAEEAVQWDPVQYSLFESERSRPFFDLVGRIGATDPRRVVDLGCGAGDLTATLVARWPGANVLGVDSSPEMIAAATAHDLPNPEFVLGAAEEFSAVGTDVLVSNALLQWVPTHRDLLRRWADELEPAGWLAFQVPANFDAPSHRLLREVAESTRWRDRLGGVQRNEGRVAEPSDYLELLIAAGLRVSAWRTEYQHVLSGPDPVLDWVRGTALRPVVGLLSAADAAEFEAEYGAKLRAAYPRREYGTVFPFTRIFVVAEKPARG
ncbi:methyltransferase domain-containing protein [Rhodococcus sp. NPDC003318]|uniref:methyltransferase domain-containing protein n=1 Tax=Rhodococcus sp. NPDC003318 TaxID=3364503 RepID=UPI003696CFCA